LYCSYLGFLGTMKNMRTKLLPEMRALTTRVNGASQRAAGRFF
jgi:hypothetical protein